jgi:hypothetical protein
MSVRVGGVCDELFFMCGSIVFSDQFSSSVFL